jgi:hypothetical protein
MKTITTTLLTLFVIAFMSPSVFACACCAERGSYFLHDSKMDDYLLGELKTIGLSSAVLYTDAGYPETIAGIQPLGESFSIKGMLSGSAWAFEITDDKSRKSVLTLWRPAKAEQFMVDQTPLDESTTVILYKELRFKYRVQSATGFLKNGIDSDTEYKLVLQGKGNGCMNARDYSSYNLKIKGKNADYSFFGKLRISEDTAMQKHADGVGEGSARTAEIPSTQRPPVLRFRTSYFSGSASDTLFSPALDIFTH